MTLSGTFAIHHLAAHLDASLFLICFCDVSEESVIPEISPSFSPRQEGPWPAEARQKHLIRCPGLKANIQREKEDQEGKSQGRSVRTSEWEGRQRRGAPWAGPQRFVLQCIVVTESLGGLGPARAPAAGGKLHSGMVALQPHTPTTCDWQFKCTFCAYRPVFTEFA